MDLFGLTTIDEIENRLYGFCRVQQGETPPCCKRRIARIICSSTIRTNRIRVKRQEEACWLRQISCAVVRSSDVLTLKNMVSGSPIFVTSSSGNLIMSTVW